MLTIRAMTGGQGYARNHLAHNDYYDQNRSVTGLWHGRGAELLGLNGEVTPESFEAMREGLHPETGEFLRPRHSADRLGSAGTAESKARSFYDLTFSAPKSVSVLALIGGDERLLDAHQAAVKEALEETERHAAARVRLGGANHDRATGNLVVAAYTHDSSRQLDPQIHTHAVAANLTHDGTEGRWKALQATGIYERRAYLTEVYRNALAREVKALGYDIEHQRNEKGIDTGFEIKGVQRELLERYSQRSQQRDASIRQFATEHGRSPTDNEVAVLVRDSRPDKLQEISKAEVHSQRLQRIAGIELEQLTTLKSQANERSLEPPSIKSHAEEAALQHASEHLFERKTVVKTHELLSEALRHQRGELELSALRGRLDAEITSGELLQSGDNITTQMNLDRERALVAMVDRGIGQYPMLLKSDSFTVSESLRTEQRQAVYVILGSTDFAINFRGAAGTGKTATLREVHRGLQLSGYEVQAVAPTRSAVEELQKVGFQNAVTISRLLEDETAQARLRGNVLVVDEAGMVSGRQMEGLLSLAKREGARIIFSGDTRQIQSVESSDALRILERESKLKSVSLTGIQRQVNPEYREAIRSFRESAQRGYEKLEAMGAIREVPYFERAQEVARTYRDLTSKSHQNVLVVAATHEEIARVTEAIRSDLKERSALDDGEVFQRHVPLQWTEAQKKDLANYQPGQVMVFHRSSRGIEKHEALTVTGVADSKIQAINERGEAKTIELSQARSFSVHERRDIEVSAGDKLLLIANRRDPNFSATNGELVTVRNVEQGAIQLEDGRTLPANYREFAHGYAITTHRSQGKTVDQVILSADAMKQELFYVAASRGRNGITVITSDDEQLQASLGVSIARPSAMELVSEMAQQKTSDLAAVNAPAIASPPKQALEELHEIGLGLGL